jgi:hypothetical protein
MRGYPTYIGSTFGCRGRDVPIVFLGELSAQEKDEYQRLLYHPEVGYLELPIKNITTQRTPQLQLEYVPPTTIQLRFEAVTWPIMNHFIDWLSIESIGMTLAAVAMRIELFRRWGVRAELLPAYIQYEFSTNLHFAHGNLPELSTQTADILLHIWRGN